MKRKLSVIIAMSIIISIILTGCSASDKSNQTTENVNHSNEVPSYYGTEYEETLKSYHDLVLNHRSMPSPNLGQLGLWEILYHNEYSDVLENVGYMIEDLSGDGIPELLIGCNNTDDVYFDGRALTLYTLSNDKPKLIFEGYSRNRYYYLNDGTFLNIGSSGAGHTYFGNYTLSENGNELISSNYYFTTLKEGATHEPGYYHNSTGNFEVNESRELTITIDDYLEMKNNLLAEVKELELIKFEE